MINHQGTVIFLDGGWEMNEVMILASVVDVVSWGGGWLSPSPACKVMAEAGSLAERSADQY